MAVNFNHTIVSARDSKKSATFLAEILDLPRPIRWGPFEVVRTDNEANIDFMTVDGAITTQHYAFLVDDPEFDTIFGRVRARGLAYWADPAQSRQNEINHHDGGRGFYFEDPDGHLLEVITRPYGSGGWNP
ncbi:MAG: VOC family protein [Aestuariivirgaceae bacterium]|jgi:catechol 2,3-dioxygenase-like lactoylglutathione lyase family enzyme